MDIDLIKTLALPVNKNKIVSMKEIHAMEMGTGTDKKPQSAVKKEPAPKVI
jgi:hypothetical protein